MLAVVIDNELVLFEGRNGFIDDKNILVALAGFFIFSEDHFKFADELHIVSIAIVFLCLFKTKK